MAKPGTLCYLKEGKAIGAHGGFVKTFNWMVNFINNLSGTEGIKIDRTDEDHPQIMLDDDYSGSSDDSGSDDSDCIRNIVVESDENSNVEGTVQTSSDGTCTITLGVFYK